MIDLTIRVFEAFAGIGAQHQALKELGLDYEIVGISEIDKHAINGYEAIHGPVNNLGDITKVEHLPECDLVTYSFPCQDLSAAGKRRGMDEGSGTRSSLLWEVGRLLTDMKGRGCLPETLLMENVDAILNEQNYPHFVKWITTLSELGYTSSYDIMNAKDYGTPQSRRRCFMVSTLTKGKFIFPAPCPDGRVLRDILESNVPESYYLSEERVAKFERHRIRQEENGRGFGWDIARTVISDEGLSPCLTTHTPREKGASACPKIIVEGELNIPGFIDHDKRVHSADGVSPCLSAQTNTQRPKIIEEDHVNWPADNDDGYMVAKEGDALVMSRPHAARSTVMDQTSFALTCGNGVGVVTKVSGVPLSEGAEGMVDDVAILTPKRTEYGKEIRKGYEDGVIEENRHNMVELVPRTDGVSNTLTGVTRDNLLAEKKIIVDGMITDTNVVQAARVVSSDGVSPSILSTGDSNGSKIKISEKDDIPIDLDDGDIASMHSPNRKNKRQNGPRFKDDGTSFTIVASDKDGIAQNEKGRLRIRYLTPRECLRLQAFPDDTIDRLMAAESKSQCYKLAGNSIAVCCLKAIFKGIYIDETFVKGGRQVSLNRWFE